MSRVQMSENHLQDWNEAPPWAKYRAMDCDGRWFWHKWKPMPIFGLWITSDLRTFDIAFAGSCSPDLYDWRKTLEHRPKDKRRSP